MSSNILVFEALPRPRRSAWLVSAYGGEWEDKYERPLAVYATKGEAIRAAEAYEAEGHDDLYCDGCAEGAYVYEIEGENYADLIDRQTCRNVYDETKTGACENGFECSECGGVVEDGEGWLVNGTFNFCPNCGARVVKTGD